MTNDNHTENLLKVMGIIRYSGRLIYPEKGKYYVNRKGYDAKEFNSLLEAQQYIDKGINDFRKLIQRQQRLREEAENNNEE